MSTLTVCHVHPALKGDDDVSLAKTEEVFLVINYPAGVVIVSVFVV